MKSKFFKSYLLFFLSGLYFPQLIFSNKKNEAPKREGNLYDQDSPHMSYKISPFIALQFNYFVNKQICNIDLQWNFA